MRLREVALCRVICVWGVNVTALDVIMARSGVVFLASGPGSSLLVTLTSVITATYASMQQQEVRRKHWTADISGMCIARSRRV